MSFPIQNKVTITFLGEEIQFPTFPMDSGSFVLKQDNSLVPERVYWVFNNRHEWCFVYLNIESGLFLDPQEAIRDLEKLVALQKKYPELSATQINESHYLRNKVYKLLQKCRHLPAAFVMEIVQSEMKAIFEARLQEVQVETKYLTEALESDSLSD